MGGFGSGPARRYSGFVSERFSLDVREFAASLGDYPAIETTVAGRSFHFEFESTRQPLGGSRWWWKCPRCGRRCRFLHEDESALVCRICAKLTYESRRFHNPSSDKTALGQNP